MSAETVADVDAQIAADLERTIIEEVRPAMAMYQHCIIKSTIVGSPTMADKFTLMQTSPAVAGAITDGTALGNTQIGPTSVTLTAAGVGLVGVITDFTTLGSNLGLADAAGYFSRGVQEKMDTDATATFANFTTNTTVGTTGVGMTLGNFQTAQYELQLAKAPGPFTCVTGPGGANQLRQAVVSSGASIFGNPNQDISVVGAVGKNAYVGNLFGVDIFFSPTNPVTGGDTYSLMFTKGDSATNNGAVGWTWKWPLKVETIRSIAFPGTQLAVTAAYGVALVNGAYGVRFQTLT